MNGNYIRFVKGIHRYCDENIGDKVLFSVFTNLWDEDKPIIKKNLIGLTEKIINDLIKKEILLEIEKPLELDSHYGYYKIKAHEDLIKNNGYMKTKMKLLG